MLTYCAAHHPVTPAGKQPAQRGTVLEACHAQQLGQLAVQLDACRNEDKAHTK